MDEKCQAANPDNVLARHTRKAIQSSLQTFHCPANARSLRPRPRPCDSAHSPERAYLQAFSVDKHLSDRLTPHVDVLDLLRCYVFSLCQFEYVLFPVDDLQGTVLYTRGWGGGCCQGVGGRGGGGSLLGPGAGPSGLRWDCGKDTTPAPDMPNATVSPLVVKTHPWGPSCGSKSRLQGSFSGSGTLVPHHVPKKKTEVKVMMKCVPKSPSQNWTDA